MENSRSGDRGTCVHLFQITARTGSVSYYIAQTTYPSESFYEKKVVASVQAKGVMFIAQPPTEDEEGIVFCNIKGDDDDESDIIIGIKPGGKHYFVISSVFCQEVYLT